MSTTERSLPASPDFSPGIVVGGIRPLLQIVQDGFPSGLNALKSAIVQAYFEESAKARLDAGERLEQQLKRAGNVLIGLRQYQLLDEAGLTPLATQMLESHDEEAARRFAQHILLNLSGVDVLRAVQDLQRRSQPATKDALAEELRTSFGFSLPRDTTKHTFMLAWLAVAGVVSGSSRGSGFEVNDSLVRELTGVAPSDVDEWQLLPLPQRAFLVSLKRAAQSTDVEPIPVKQVLDAAELEYGTLYRGGQTAKNVVKPLVDFGWIEVSLEGSSGRGGKSGSVTPAERLENLDLDVVQGFHVPPLPPDLRRQLGKPLDEIRRDLVNKDTFVAGVALELLALRMAIALGLAPTEMRKRDDKTGGGEVDLTAEGVHLHYSRWLFQCKNQKSAVTVGTLAKELGMAVLLRAHVIVIATTGRFADTVAEYARQTAETTLMQVVLVDGAIVRSFLVSGDSALKDHFRRSAADTVAIKRPQASIAAE